MKPLVYVASPYTRGHQGWNARAQCDAFDKLLDSGVVVPFTPLWSHFQEIVSPRPYESWLAWDFEMIARCDAMLRLDAILPQVNYHECRSSGADREVEHMRKLGKPVFYSYEELYQWAATQETNANRSVTS